MQVTKKQQQKTGRGKHRSETKTEDKPVNIQTLIYLWIYLSEALTKQATEHVIPCLKP